MVRSLFCRFSLGYSFRSMLDDMKKRYLIRKEEKKLHPLPYSLRELLELDVKDYCKEKKTISL